MIDYTVKKADSEELTKAHRVYFNNLLEMNRVISDRLRDWLIKTVVSVINQEAKDIVDSIFEEYKGKLFENLVEINFLESKKEAMIDLLDDDEYYEDPETTYLYMIEAKDSQRIKIGIAKSVDSRLAALQTANPEELKVINQMEFDYRSEALDAEKLFHEYFEDYRIMPRGKSTEWFKSGIKKYAVGLTKEHIPQIKQILEKRKQKMADEMNKVHFGF